MLKCLVFIPTGTVLGAVVMEGYYVVFDRENQRVGFAKTHCLHNNISDSTSLITGPFLDNCKYTYK